MTKPVVRADTVLPDPATMLGVEQRDTRVAEEDRAPLDRVAVARSPIEPAGMDEVGMTFAHVLQTAAGVTSMIPEARICPMSGGTVTLAVRVEVGIETSRVPLEGPGCRTRRP